MPSRWMIYGITYQRSQTFSNTGVRTSCLTWHSNYIHIQRALEMYLKCKWIYSISKVQLGMLLLLSKKVCFHWTKPGLFFIPVKGQFNDFFFQVSSSVSVVRIVWLFHIYVTLNCKPVLNKRWVSWLAEWLVRFWRRSVVSGGGLWWVKCVLCVPI